MCCKRKNASSNESALHKAPTSSTKAATMPDKISIDQLDAPPAYDSITETPDASRSVFSDKDLLKNNVTNTSPAHGETSLHKNAVVHSAEAQYQSRCAAKRGRKREQRQLKREYRREKRELRAEFRSELRQMRKRHCGPIGLLIMGVAKLMK